MEGCNMPNEIRDRIRNAMLEDEAQALARLIRLADLPLVARERICVKAAGLVVKVRSAGQPGIMEAFLAEFGLSTKEGIALMCLAEALLRVPDAGTVDDLIQDKIVPNNWGAHIGDSGSMLVNASTWALMLTGRVLEDDAEEGIAGSLRSAVRRLGEPVIRTAVGRAMREMGAQFVLGRDIREAAKRGAPMVQRGYSYSYDMLGEAARTETDAARYHGAYAQAIAAIAACAKSDDIRENPGISVKLSALHPRYEFSQHETTLPELSARLLQLAQAAKMANIGLNIDAEEADRLDISLDMIERVLSDPSLAGWDGFGVVVQAYGIRCAHVIDWLYALTQRLDRKVMVRLVKGAYWDAEVKRAQVLGLAGFPVFTRKANTDVSYIANARKLLSMRDRIYPQFATHNAHSVAAILEMAGDDRDSFEFQRLHGMGENLHDIVMQEEKTRCRIYAPVGAHRDLLAYLVRRLLENGANSSFVNQIVDEEVSPEYIARDPFELADGGRNSVIRHPETLFGARRNSKGWDITDPGHIAIIEKGRSRFEGRIWQAGAGSASPRAIYNPANPADHVGDVADATFDEARAEIGIALAAFNAWAAVPVVERADILRRAADLYERNAYEIFTLLTREAGKTLMDCIGELREAADFLRYYADQAVLNEAESQPRGVIVCISPWNFPLAIFTGQIAAALATGNSVVAKPAEQTSLIAALAVRLLHQADVPEEVLRLICGAGDTGAAITSDPEIGGVCFTGSTEVAKIIDRQLALSAPAAMLIAETGGLNAMIVDSTALPEQAVRDILASAFQSAGQRCSALRILYIQRDIEERILEMLFGAMDALTIGDPLSLSTDAGPVIDQEARNGILDYIAEAEGSGRILKQMDAPDTGWFVPPTVIRVNGIGEMPEEIFGPVLHIARFDSEKLDNVVEAVNKRGYGLTFGLHTRIDRRVQHLVDRVKVGNFYVNRNQIGAVVGSQPFGGHGLSGTGPKAGGPHYLAGFRNSLLTDEGAKTVIADTLSMPDAAEIDAAFDALQGDEWAVRADRVSALRLILRGQAAQAMTAAAALDTGPIDLPGPTGESNRLTLLPKGRILCLGPSPEALLAQVVQALRAGNCVIALGMLDARQKSVLNELEASGLPVALIEGTASDKMLCDAAIDGVAYAGDDDSIRRFVAAREGAIMTLITDMISPSAYTHESVLCIDTTAAGGNATLLAAAG